MSHSLTYGGVYLGGDDYGVINRRSARIRRADPRLDLQQLSARDGGFAQVLSTKMLSWSDSWLISGTSRADKRRKLDNINFVLDPRNGPQELVYDDDVITDVALDRMHYAITNGPQIDEVRCLHESFALNWVNPNGIQKALLATTETPTIASDPQVFNVPVSALEVVGGNNAPKPTYTIENTSGGAVTSITLTNTMRGETLRWTGVLPDTWFMRIDCERQYITRSSTGAFAGEETSAMSGLTAGDPFPLLNPRVRNALSLSGFSTANLTVEYTAEFI
jgi:hypothetical protein